ncbi:LPXTG cell wall anchor domain-containing protein [Streptococcus pyogenes]
MPRTGSKGSFVYGSLGYTSVALLSLIAAIKKKKY